MQARRLAAAATAKLRRRGTRNAATASLVPAESGAEGEILIAVTLACKSVFAAARRLGVTLETEDAIVEEAMGAVARIDAEIEKLRNSGGLKSINKSYQRYRIETSARGEPALRYAEWMCQYREKLVRTLASTLRFF
jgi:hypothetical protein